jgi:hypothetical protein
MKTPVPHHEHLGCHRAQNPEASNTLTRAARPEARVHDGVRATLGQIYGAGLGKRTWPPRTKIAAKNRHVIRSVGQVFQHAVNGHQAPHSTPETPIIDPCVVALLMEGAFSFQDRTQRFITGQRRLLR